MRKLMWFTVGFAGTALLCGYGLAGSLWLPAMLLCLVVLVGCICLLSRWKGTRVPAAIMAGMVLSFAWQFAYDGLYLTTVRDVDNTFVQVELLVTEPVEKTQYGLAAEGTASLAGKDYKIRLYLDGDVSLALGDTVTGRFHLKSTLSGGSADNAYSRAGGIFLTGTDGVDIKVFTPDKLPISCWLAWVRTEITGLLDSTFPEDTLAFARALLLGDTSLIDYETDTDLKISGIRHVVSVSGLHVTILVSLLMLLLGRRRILVAAVVLPSLLFFAAVVGFSPSITRACLMHGLMVIAMLFHKEYDPPTSLAFAVLVMLAVNPMTAVNVGFQLSVGCMAGIFLFAEPIQGWLKDARRLGKYKFRRLTAWFSGSVSISIGAAIVTTPLCALYFGTVSLVSILTNLLTLWLVTLVFYGIMAAALAALLWVPLGSVIAWVVAWGIRCVLAIAGLMAELPFAAVYTDSIYIVFWLVFCYMLLGVFLLMKQKRPLGLTACAIFGLCLAVLLSWTEPMQDGCRLTAIDVGQGQCILLQADGKNFLVDCGGDTDEIAADRAAQLLLSQGISRLDGIIVTHYDRDHVGGVPLLLTRISADALYLPDSLDQDHLADTLTAAQTQVYRVNSMQELAFADTRITLIPSEVGAVSNESGLCILFQRENCDILITGDRSHSGEEELLESIRLPQLDVLVAGHHGSANSTGWELLAQTVPETVIISVGADNHYGHPAQEVLDRLSEFGCTYYRTDECGTVIYRG